MSGNSCCKLIKASDFALSIGVLQILAVLKLDETLALSGSENSLRGVFWDEKFIPTST